MSDAKTPAEPEALPVTPIPELSDDQLEGVSGGAKPIVITIKDGPQAFTPEREG